MEPQERIEKIEKEIRETPYHKATEHHIGKLRAKLAKLKNQLFFPPKKGKGVGFAIKKEGDATVVLLGFPSVGKSTLLNQLTQAKSKVADYDFTTLTVIPGMMRFNGALIQILDLPGIIAQAAKGKGWGRQILSTARAADLLLILIEAQKLDQEKIIRQELYEAGVRINQKPPSTTIKEKTNKVYLPAVFVINKIDLVNNFSHLRKQYPDYLFISAEKNIGLKKLKEVLWEKLELIKVYLKPKDGQPDFDHPLIFKKGATILDVAQKISQDLAQNLKGGRIFGPKAIFEDQKVGVNYQLFDQAIITLLD